MNCSLCSEKDDIRYRITSLYISIMLFVFPLFVGFTGYTNLTISKYLFFVIITLLWLVSLIIFSIIKKSIPTISKKFWIPCVGFMLSCCVSSLFSDHFAETLIGTGRYGGLATQLLCGFIFLGVAHFAKLKSSHFILCALSASICCAIAVFQLFDINIFALFPSDYSYYDAHIKYSGEFLGTLGNVDLLTAFLSMCIPILFSLLIGSDSKLEYFYAIALFLCTFILICAATAAGFLAFLGWAAIFLPAMCSNLKNTSRALTFSPAILIAAALALAFKADIGENQLSFSFVLSLPVILLILLAIACIVCGLIVNRLSFSHEASPRGILYIAVGTAFTAALIFVWSYNGTEGTIYEFSQILRGNFEDSFGSSRILIWRNILPLIPERPLFGHGSDIISLITDIEFSRYVPQTDKTLSTYVDNAHNIYLGYLAGNGIVGLGLFLATVFSAFSILKTKSLYRFALCGAIVGYMIHSFFGLGLCIVSPIFWIFLGLAAAECNKHLED